MRLTAEHVLQLIRERVAHPASADELVRLLRVQRLERPMFKRLLKGLVGDGHLVLVRGHLYALPREKAKVAAPRAAIQKLVGRFESLPSGHGVVVPFDRRAMDEVEILRAEIHGAEAGQMVWVEITRQPSSGMAPRGRVLEVLGDADAPGVDTTIVLRKHGIAEDHDPAAVEEARALGTTVLAEDIVGRTDFRDRIVVTIDGEHARDFDDAISIERLTNGNYWLGVHIADVAHYVREGSALDRDGYDRATSVYFPERAVHMFPSDLATGLCSLRPHVDRLVQSCLMEVAPDGAVVRYEMHDGVIHSAARMTYTGVNAILTDRDPEMVADHAAFVPTFELMGELFTVLNGRRRRRGSVDFDLPEAQVILDTDGFIEDIIASDRNVAHRLIEEFMLLANETVAGHLETHHMPALYRVHEPPDALKVEVFETFINTLGFTLNAAAGGVKPSHFQRLVEKIHGQPAERSIAMLMLRTMQKARYDAANLGHFGLAAPSYTHFTSPIRRYPDLLVHRLLREQRLTKVTDDRREQLEAVLPEAGRHTSERERRADDAERELIQWKKVRFMADKVGDAFDGYVTGVTHFGVFVELTDHYVEGLVHVSTMADDYYRFDETAHTLFGERSKKVYRLGDKVRVQIVRVDMERRMIDLGLEDVLDQVRTSEQRRGSTRSHARPKKEQRKATPEQRRQRKAQRLGKQERQAKKSGRR